jgi:hypothetical protein
MKDTTFKIKNQEFRIFLSDKMKNFNQHTLHQINIEINTTHEPKAHELKNELNSFLKEALLPSVEHLLNELAAPNETKRLDTINLEIDMKKTETLSSTMSQIINQLRKKIAVVEVEFSEPEDLRNQPARFNSSKREKNEINTGASEASSLKQQKTDLSRKRWDMEGAFLFFLDSGQLPWYATPSSLENFMRLQIFSTSLQDDFFVLKLKQLFRSNPNASQRFVQQFSNDVIESLIFKLSETEKIHTKKLQIKISGINQSLKDLLYEPIISKLIQADFKTTQLKYQQLYHKIRTGSRSTNKQHNQIKEILRLIDPENADFENGKNNQQDKTLIANGSEIQSSIKDAQRPQAVKDAAPQVIYLQNAGLILAHVFFWDLFSRTQCTDGNSSLLPEKKQLAVHLLHYLATGREHEMEYNLAFEKFLCGVSLNSPINRKLVIQEQEKSECDDLLHSVVRLWPALKNTSPDGLRQMFIQRDGKLDLHKSPYKLYVERKAQDILLDQLQWSISIVKLPWTNELLFTEW